MFARLGSRVPAATGPVLKVTTASAVSKSARRALRVSLLLRYF